MSKSVPVAAVVLAVVVCFRRTARLNRYGVDMGPLGPAGYTIGPDGPAAGTAFLLLGVCE
jgi:hypothetical protein